MATADAAIENTLYKIGSFRVDREIVRYIREASDTCGVSFDYMLAKAGHESRFEVNAAAERSSAEGLYQFTTETWLQQMKLHGAKYGYAKLANKIYRDGRGRYRVQSKEDREEILSLRRSPRISALLAAEFAKTNQKILQDQIGGDISPIDLYIAHFMGPSGAVMLLRADKFTPQKHAADLFPEAAMANPPIFYKDRNKTKMRTVRQVRNLIEDMFQEKINYFAVLPKSLKVWLEKQPKGSAAERKAAVVVEAPILRLEAGVTGTLGNEAPPPMPKLVENLQKAKILPGEGINLDDDDLLEELKEITITMSASSGKDDAVSADLIPEVFAEYNVAGMNAVEADFKAMSTVVYTSKEVTYFESDDYLISTPLPVLMTAQLAVDTSVKEN